MTKTEVVDLLVEGCKDMVKSGNMQQVTVGDVVNYYKFAFMCLLGRGSIERELENY